jgi:hypothetical protein
MHRHKEVQAALPQIDKEADSKQLASAGNDLSPGLLKESKFSLPYLEHKK